MDESITLLDIADKALLPLLAIVATLAGGYLSARLSRDNDNRRQRLELRRDVYFEAIDTGYEMLDAMRTIAAMVPGSASDPDADTEGAVAIQRMMALTFSLPRIESRVAVVGSQAALNAVSGLRQATNRWLAAAGQQISGDGVFRGAVARGYMQELERESHRLADAARSELGVGASLRKSSVFDPPTAPPAAARRVRPWSRRKS